jgi:hypothetical protein
MSSSRQPQDQQDDIDSEPEMLAAEDVEEIADNVDGDVPMDSDDEDGEEINLLNDGVVYFEHHKDSVFAIAQHAYDACKARQGNWAFGIAMRIAEIQQQQVALEFPRRNRTPTIRSQREMKIRQVPGNLFHVPGIFAATSRKREGQSVVDIVANVGVKQDRDRSILGGGHPHPQGSSRRLIRAEDPSAGRGRTVEVE